jgi:hypothetical protein
MIVVLVVDVIRYTWQDVQTRLLEETKTTRKRMHPVHAPTFNATIQNKIDPCKSDSIPYGPISKQDSQTVVVSNRM